MELALASPACRTILPHPIPSPLMLADRLISLAEDADRAGFRTAAIHLVGLVYAVLDDPGAAG